MVEPHLQVWPGSLDRPRKQRELPRNRLELAGPSHNSISNISILFRICSVLEQQHHHIILWVKYIPVCFCMVPNKFPQPKWFIFYSLLFDLLCLEGKGQAVYFTSITISLLQLWLTFFNRFSINSENCLNRLWRLPWLPGGQINHLIRSGNSIFEGHFSSNTGNILTLSPFYFSLNTINQWWLLSKQWSVATACECNLFPSFFLSCYISTSISEGQ